MASTHRQGRLIKWDDDKGFGFIQVEGYRDIFVHISEIKEATRRPQTGDMMQYNIAIQSGKAKAVNAYIEGARRQLRVQQPTQGRSVWLILQLVGLLILPLLGSMRLAGTSSNFLPLLIYPAVSVVTFSLYASDKRQAKQQAWRTPEQQLHLAELAGGWPGGFFAQQTLRHKNRKQSYQMVFWAIVSVHQIGWLVWLAVGL